MAITLGSILKGILKFLLLVLLTTLCFILVSAFLPYSEELKNLNKNAGAGALPSLVLNFVWLCGAILFVIRNSTWKRLKLMGGVIVVFFCVSIAMTQIETLFFADAFPLLTKRDIFLIAVANGVPIFAAVPLSMWLFRSSSAEGIPEYNTGFPRIGRLFPGLVLIGLLYLIIYFVFGYFVAWQEETLRVFYWGQSDIDGFLNNLVANFRRNPWIFPFQFIRGILFGLIVLPLMAMLKDRPSIKLTGLVLVMLSAGNALIIPNPLFPDTVRWAHFREMMSSMFLFAIVLWFVYDRIVYAGINKKHSPGYG